VAGETAEEFLEAARRANAQGFAVACGILGEGVATREEACAAAGEYCALLRRFASEGIDANVAFKITHVGLDVDPELAFRNVRRIAETAAATGNTMRIDMEQSRYVDATLAAYRRLREEFSCTGFVLQSYLRRSVDDLRALLPLEPNVRIVKGAYLESADVAFARKREVDANYLRLIDVAFSAGGYTAIATHDRRIVEPVIARTEALRLPRRGRFEFQLLYGINAPLARELVSAGYRVRLAIPFGTYWFPYLMRRLAERPANLAFFLRGAFTR
jgi:proline dehydrogenase